MCESTNRIKVKQARKTVFRLLQQERETELVVFTETKAAGVLRAREEEL